MKAFKVIYKNPVEINGILVNHIRISEYFLPVYENGNIKKIQETFMPQFNCEAFSVLSLVS